MTTELSITLKNCNNIDKGNIIIKKNHLNIKYGINGTGKSTIANAIDFYIKDKKEGSDFLHNLKPFKFKETETNNPEIKGLDEIRNVKIFNEEYVKNIVFQEDDLLKGSFDILIKTDEYEKGIEEIETLIKDVKDSFIKNPEIEELILDFKELLDLFGKETRTGIYKSSKFMKGLGHGNKISNIPTGLECYKDYISLEENVKWIKWQQQGKEYLDLSDNCPYCVSDIKGKKITILKVSEVYDPKSIEHLNLIIELFNKFKKYFSKDTIEVMEKLVKKADEKTDEELNYFITIRKQVELLLIQFIKTMNLCFSSLKNVDKIIEELKNQKIKMEFYPNLNSIKVNEKVNIINKAIDNTLNKVGILQGKINQQNKLIEKLIITHKKEINLFLKNAGFNYEVFLEENDEGVYKLKLSHIAIGGEVKEVRSHLSFGERNAFSLVLFMYEVLKYSPDLIILDDPISSFDKNKKYAIIDMLFKRECCLRGKTILLLTHDFEPIIDMKHTHANIFGDSGACFLENDNGELKEKIINNSDICSFSDICEKNIHSPIHIVNKLIYLRRLFEVNNSKGEGYQLISNLLHKREHPELIDGNKMKEDAIILGTNEITNKIPDFRYSDILNILNDDEKMKRLYLDTISTYEKLNIFRIFFEGKERELHSVINKFINETFHIENDFIFQLNPSDYQLIPQFIMKECDQEINNYN